MKNEPFSVHDFLKPGIEEMCQLLPSFLARPILCVRRAQRLARPRLFRHGDQFDLDQRLSALPDAGQAARLRPLRPSLQAGAERRSNPGSALIAEAARQLGRTRARSRRMRAVDQGLRRHLCARARQLPQHRGARDPPGAGGPYPAARAADAVASARTAALGRSRGRKPRQMPGRNRWQPELSGSPPNSRAGPLSAPASVE